MSFTIYWHNCDAEVVFHGKLDFDQISHVNAQFTSSPEFDSMKYQLWDLRQVKTLNVPQEQLRIIGAIDKSASFWKRKLKIALVAPDPHIRTRCYDYIDAMQGTNWHIRVFSNFPDAQKWCEE